jgi:hypothetical protein
VGRVPRVASSVPLHSDRFSTSQHPTLGLYLSQPVSHGGNSAEIFKDVLLADEPHGENPAGRERERGAG